MYQLIAKNKRRSWALIASFFVIIAGIGYLLSLLTEDGYGLFAIALVFSFVSVLISFFAGDRLVLASVGAKPLDKQQDPELYRIVENLAITAGIPLPKIYLIPDEALNAFATGRDPQHASVAITIGLRRILTKTELEAVMGHELSHIKHYDIRVMLLTAVLVGMVLFLSDMLWRFSFSGDRDSRKNSGYLAIPALLIGLILAPLAAQMIKLAISRRREFLADAGSVMLTRYPESMISALQKIAQAPTVRGHHEAIAHLFIYPPFKKTSFWAKLLSTHPPMEERIQAIVEAARVR
jgi:heat shock protein HtpX